MASSPSDGGSPSEPGAEAGAGGSGGTGHSEVVASFCAITGALPHVASHYLDAMGYNLARSIDYFYQNPPDAGGAAPRFPAVDAPAAPAAAGATDDDDIVEVGSRPVGSGGSFGARGVAFGGAGLGMHDGTVGEDMHDDEEADLQRALAASMHPEGAAAW
eukprot:62623-Chlamydomonas_euryale.AAC.2